MGDEREGRVGFVGDRDGVAQGNATALHPRAIAREDGREWLSLLHPIARACRDHEADGEAEAVFHRRASPAERGDATTHGARLDRKSTRLNSSHTSSSYAVFCLQKKCML